MNKSLFLSVLALMSGSTMLVNGAHITPRQALDRLNRDSNISGMLNLTRSSLEHTATIGDLYVFSDNRGYVILPADDQASSLLAYSDNETFSEDGNPALRYWLEFYNRQLQWLASRGENSVTVSRSETRPTREPISPLTMTRWNQEAPYNALCPEVNGKGTVTGCVATAMAQVMKYHSYPVKGKGEHSYYWEPGAQTLSFNFGETTFEWDKMTNTYDSNSSEEAKKAVATLMLACGISVDMHYDVGDSGASTIKMGASLIDYFDYDRGIWMPMRDYYGLYDWENMIYSELKEGRPVLYSGQGTGGGHQFICDGYSSDGYFHFNWGWGGMSDGYFLLTALNPADLGVGGGAGGFNSGQQICLGVKPAESGSVHTYIMYCADHFVTKQKTVSAGQELLFKGGFYNYSLSSLPDKSEIGMKIIKSDGSDARFVKGYNISGLGCLEGYEEDIIKFPELPDGNYIISPAFYDGEKWYEIPVPLGAVGECYAEVKDHTANLTSEEPAVVSVVDVKAPDKIYKNCQFPLEFTVDNKTDREFYGDITPILTDVNSSKIIATSVYRPLDLLGKEKVRIEDYIGKFTAVSGEEFNPGEYMLAFRDNAGKEISEPIKVTVEATPEKTTFRVTSFVMDEKEPVTNKSAVKFSFGIKCEEGYFADRIHLYIFPGNYGYDLAGAASPMIYLPSGESTESKVTVDLAHLDDGEYIAILYYGSDSCSNEIRFKLEGSSGIEETLGDDTSEKIIYDLNGVRHTVITKPGIYIINGVKTVVK